MKKTCVFLLLLLILSLSNCGTSWLVEDPNYKPNCSSCHGKDLKGSALGSSLLTDNLIHGHITDSIIKSITYGYPEKGMPGFSDALSEEQIKYLALWIGEKRANTSYGDYKVNEPIHIPKKTILTESHDFKIEIVATDLDPWPYSIEPLPDGSFLLTEKRIGLSLIHQDGTQYGPIEGTPTIYNDVETDAIGLIYGLGWMLDVVTHPEYEKNGWIYLTYGDRCENCNAESRTHQIPVSLCKVVRGRIKEGKWIDQETIWEGDIESYTGLAETATGGRITFDEENHLYFSLGAKKHIAHPPGNYEAYLGIQDLSMPYGKIYRINDDGTIPTDNPYYGSEDAINSIWTYGHRSPQGLEYNSSSQQLWGTEMGPRGGDEINLLEGGKNYGWPLYSKGINYNATKVEYGKYLNIDFDLKDIEQPKVDLTPSPAVSSFAIYQGDQFLNWTNNLIVGSLKAASLYRYVINGSEVIQQEILIKDLGRIRDVEVGSDGLIYLLLEEKNGGMIVRLVPE